MRYFEIVGDEADDVCSVDEDQQPAVKPRTPQQQQQRNAKVARVQQQQRDEQSRHVARVRELQSKANEA